MQKLLRLLFVAISVAVALAYWFIITTFSDIHWFDQLSELTNVKAANLVSAFNFTQCVSVFETVPHHFLSEMEVKEKLRFAYPTYLFSYGGSGNTLTRLLIEEITDIWTGSPYHDAQLYQLGFVGEMFCEELNRVIVIKYHPENIKKKMNDINNFYKPCFGRKPLTHSIQWPYISAIFIMRNPWHATWSEFQLHNNPNKTSKHLAHFALKDFDIPVFKRFVKDSFTAWQWTFTLMDIMNKNGFTNYTVINYQNLINVHSPSVALREMDTMIRFLFQDEYYMQNKRILHIKMECIIHHLMPNDYRRFGAIHRSKPDPTMHVTMQYAYSALDEHDKEFMCNQWEQIKHKAELYNFTLLQGINCSMLHFS
eukprot:856538_1